MADFIEERHELKVSKRVVDVRPWSEKFKEWVSEPFNLVLLFLPLALCINIVPSFGWIFALTAFVVIMVHRHVKVVMPLRYPAMNVEPDPSTGKPGDGILFFGNVRSSSSFEKFKEVWGSDDSGRKHMLIIGSTGSGKSETLKGIFFNSLAWTSGFFVADGKADNKLPTDTHALARSFGRDDDCLYLNFLLGGRTPEQVRRSRRRRTNKINPFSTADADTVIQMGANMLPKVEGEGKNWQEKALNLWRALVVALCYKRDTQGVDLSVATLIDYMALPEIEELYVEGYEEAQSRGGEWSYGFVGIKAYLESGCPAYKVDKLLAKNGLGDAPAAPPGYGGGGARVGNAKQFEQEAVAYEQHAYRTTQLMPVLNLLDKTYGYIFRDKYPEIDMVDCALNNRILCMLIPSLEKSAQEAENLGKLAIASLRVMMGRNLGSEIEGTRQELLDSKATNANYPYTVALDELAYYFADGIAVMFAQARSLGMSMIAACQDLEKLTEGSRASEAGAMLANQVTKIFMRIDDAKKTYEMVSTILGKVTVAVRKAYERSDMGWSYKSGEVELQEVERASLAELQSLSAGQGLINAEGKTTRIATFYVGDDLKKYRTDEFYVLRFLQVRPPTPAEVNLYSMPIDAVADPVAKGQHLLSVLKHEALRSQMPAPHLMIEAISEMAARLGESISAEQRAVMLYQAAKRSLSVVEGDFAGPGTVASGGSRSGGADAERLADAVVVSGGQGRVLRGGVGAVRGAGAFGERGGFGLSAFDEGADEAGHGQSGGAGYAPALDDPLAFLDADASFSRKPAEEVLSAQDMAPSASQTAVIDPVMLFISSGRYLNLPHVDGMEVEADGGISPAELLAGGMSLPSAFPASMGLSELDEQLFMNSIANPAIVPSNVDKADLSSSSLPAVASTTVVGLSQKSLEQVEVLEELLGSTEPKRSARKLEAVVSQGVTPSIVPDGPIDEQSLAALFDDFKERNS